MSRASPTRRVGALLLGAGVLVALVAGVAWLLLSTTPDGRGEGSTPGTAATNDEQLSLPAGFRVAWTPGWRYRYRFSLSQESETQLMPGVPAAARQSISATVELRGELVVDPIAVDRALGSQARLRLSQLEPHVLNVAERVLLTDALLQDIDDDAVVLKLSPDGSVERIQPVPGTRDVVIRLFHLLASEWQVRVQRDADQWRAVERTQHGEVESRYTLTSVNTEDRRATMQRERTRYTRIPAAPGGVDRQQLSSHADVVLSLDGHPLLLESEETLLVPGPGPSPALSSRSSTHLELVAREPRGTPLNAIAAAPGSTLLGFADTDATERSHLDQRIAGLTAAQLLDDLDRHGPSGRIPDHNRWLWRATGLIRAEPALASKVAAFATRTDIGHAGRGLALDLLVGAGTDAAQASLLQALSSPSLRDHPRHRVYLQRLSLVSQPGDAVIDFLQEALADAEGLDRAAVQAALGAVADHRAQSGDSTGAEQIAAQLAQALAATTDPTAQAQLIEALGNAGLDGQAALLRPYASSPDARVRLAVASSLRKMAAPPATETLLDLAGDAQPEVAARAFQSLAPQALGAPELDRLYRMVQGRAVPEPSYQALVSTLQPLLPTRARARTILELILQQPLADNTIKTRVRALLGA